MPMHTATGINNGRKYLSSYKAMYMSAWIDFDYRPALGHKSLQHSEMTCSYYPARAERAA